MNRITKRIKISGDVQGVGFRYSMLYAANEAGVTGWVRNCRDGSVEAVVQGPADAVQIVVEWARRGPSAARVERVDVSDEPGGERFNDFSIRNSA